MESAVKCKTLLGNKNLEFSIKCLQSFIINSYKEIELEIYEDGTLSQTDIDKLISSLKGCVVITKRERDKVITDKLRKYPECYRMRSSHVLAMKLFDTMLYGCKEFWFIDSDVFFLQKFLLPSFTLNPIFILDTGNAYSFNPREFLNIKVPIFKRVNTGLLYFPFELYNLDYIEKLLSLKVMQKNILHVWSEQTIWAFLAARSDNVNYFNSLQITMARRKLELTEHTIAVHLVTTYRYHFDTLNLMSFRVNNDMEGYKIITLTNVSTYLNKFEFAIERIIKKSKRHLGLGL